MRKFKLWERLRHSLSVVSKTQSHMAVWILTDEYDYGRINKRNDYLVTNRANYFTAPPKIR